MQDSIRFDRWWARFVGVFVVLFLGWFIIREFEGFIPLGEMLIGAVAAIPSALENVVNYFGSVTFVPVAISMIVGAEFGAVTTVIVYLSAKKIIELPRFTMTALWFGIASAVVGFVAGMSTLQITLIFLIGALFASILMDNTWRELFSRRTWRMLQTAQARKLIVGGLIVGGVVGGIGSQFLTTMMRHCTYQPEGVDMTTRWMGYAITAISALIFLVPAWTILLRQRNRRTESTSGFFKGWSLPLVFLLPTLLSLLFFLYYPTFQIAAQSLLRVRRGRGAEPQFTCLDNYINLMNNSVYQSSFLTTITVTVAIVIFSMSIALLIALLASQKVRGASIYRTLLIWPYALSPVVTAAIFISMFRDDRSGLINHMLHSLNFDTIRWLTDASVAPWVLIGASVYNILGFNIIFYVAGLQNVPRDLLEAAEIDGANIVQRFLRITIPLLSPYTFFLLIANITYSFYGIYGVIDTLFPGGGPLLADGQSRAANVLIYKVYEDSFRSGATQLGDVAAQSMILFLLVASITLLQFRYIESRVTYAD